MKTVLPNGCSVSPLSILPSNWKTSKKSIEKEWQIQYRFYDPSIRDKDGKIKPKHVRIKRMNSYADWEARKEATLLLLEQEWDMLKRLGYNPYTKTTSTSGMFTECSPFLPSLYMALDKMEVIKRVKDETAGYLKYMAVSISSLYLDTMPIQEVEPKHIVSILQWTKDNVQGIYEHLLGKGEKLQPPKEFTPAKYNRYRKALQMLFKVLESDLHLIKTNPVAKIKRIKQTKLIRKTLSTAEQKTVMDHLYTYYRDFYLFCQVFYSSGARETEILSVKYEDIDLQSQTYKCIVRKRQEGPVQIERVITDGALPFWKEIMDKCEPGMYLFSYEFKPGYNKQNANQVNKWWRKIVKQGLDIDVDFYKFKHLFTTRARAILTAKEIAEQHGHTDSSMVEEIYDTEALIREQKKIRKLPIKL